jgi:hypothetical protein
MTTNAVTPQIEQDPNIELNAGLAVQPANSSTISPMPAMAVSHAPALQQGTNVSSNYVPDWNPVNALKAKYPTEVYRSGQSDADIASNLQDPAKFREAFPEYDVSDDEIKMNMQNFISKHPEYGSWTKGETHGVLSAGARVAKTLYSALPAMYHSVVDGPKDDDEAEIANNGIESSEGHIPGALALPLWRLIGKPMEEAQQRSDQYTQMAAQEQNPKFKKALIDAAGSYSMAAKLPMVGPMAGNMTERFEYGDLSTGTINPDPSGALAEGIGYALTPEMMKKAPGLVGDLAKAGVSATAEAAGRVVPKAATAVADTAYQAGKAGLKYVVAPVARGVGAGLIEVGTDAISDLADKITDSVKSNAGDVKAAVSNALQSGGEAGKALLAKAGPIADDIAGKIQAGGTVAADEVTAVLKDHMELYSDLIGRNFDKLATTVSSALSDAIAKTKSATTPQEVADTLPNLRNQVRSALDGVLPPEAVNEVLDKVVDEHYVQTHPVSGGNVDEPGSFEASLKEIVGKYMSDAANMLKPPETPVAAAMKIVPELGNISTAGDQVGGGLKAFENILRKNPAGAHYLAEQDANAAEGLKHIVPRAVTNITGGDLPPEFSTVAEPPSPGEDPSSPRAVANRMMASSRGEFLDRLIKGDIHSFNDVIESIKATNPDPIDQATATTQLRQALAKRILENSFDEETGEFRNDIFTKNINANADKLGPVYDDLNTVNKGIKQLTDSWALARKSAGAYQGFWGTATSRVINGILFGGTIGAMTASPLRGVAAMALEIAGEYAATDIAPRVLVKVLMQPGMIQDMNVVARFAASTTARVPTPAVKQASTAISQAVKKATDSGVEVGKTVINKYVKKR